MATTITEIKRHAARMFDLEPEEFLNLYPHKQNTHVTDAVKVAIVTAFRFGFRSREIAAEFNRHRTCVSHFKKTLPPDLEEKVILVMGLVTQDCCGALL